MEKTIDIKEKAFTSTRNACKVCTPLGASIVFKGIEGCVPLIHGSQGCATYIRRYLISHYKEPVDIASTNFSEETAIFGGEKNLFIAIENVTKQYNPKIIGIATTCLSEVIGDDMRKIIHKYKTEHDTNIPELVFVNTPSFMGTHINGFHDTVTSIVAAFASNTENRESINIFPGFLSPADLQHLKEILTDVAIDAIMVPDYSDILDNEYTGEYEKLPKGGTTIKELKQTACAKASLEFGYILNKSNPQTQSAAEYLKTAFDIPRVNLNIPIGIKATDALFDALEKITNNKTPEKYTKQRGKLIDAYVDGHKYVFGKKAVVYGEEDFVVAMISFLEEIGIETVLCASGGNSGLLKEVIQEKVQPKSDINIHDNFDFEEIATVCKELKPDIIIGNSKGYYIARELGIPLARVGFPIHDRLGGSRIKHIGYEGTQALFDLIANTLIQQMQDHSPVGYKYM
ncbi:nitrogenase molybdenum-iron protein NifN [Lutibacter agarilyticus]|uniref:Nitrogenase molybdenum-iron protein NifN n=1 Tax=Lutibacter agarilyticus TaxID=1109740 RepID=A0A238YBL7_9FLAO|nr:nitrogenase component 1 [Lutibacter agarilyticus]SNR67994.1 nitrogenase molybdenum-iron protein NifN [Lutibacter agarilyticus]